MALERTEPEVRRASDVAFDAVHVIALRGLVPRLGADGQELLDAGLVAPVQGGFQLTAAGHSSHRALLERERSTLDLSRLEMVYAPVAGLAPVLARVRRAWRQPLGRLARRRLILQLCDLVDDTAPVLRRAVVIAPRFSGYLPRFNAAAAKLRAGELDYAFATDLDSVGAVWQELHEDFLQTLGRAQDVDEL
jgi:hypothetical protein